MEGENLSIQSIYIAKGRVSDPRSRGRKDVGGGSLPKDEARYSLKTLLIES